MDDGSKPRLVVAEHGKFEMVPHWILFDTGLSHVAVRLYLVLRQHANHADECFPGRKRLANLLGVSIPTLDRARSDLVTAGAICEQHRYTEDHGSSSNLYHIHWEPGPCQRGGNKSWVGGSAGDTGGGYEMLQGGVTEVAQELIPITNSNPLTQTLQKPVGDDPGFDAFWQQYPRKSAKGHARRAWAKAVKIASPDIIVAGAVRYRNDPNREDQYTALPATWLNGERWSDEPLPGRTSRSDQKVSDVQAMIARAAERDQKGIGS